MNNLDINISNRELVSTVLINVPRIRVLIKKIRNYYQRGTRIDFVVCQ